jgi:hypothetical protein
MCTFVSQSRLERAVGNSFSTAHEDGDLPVYAGCHFPAAATGGTDLALNVSSDVAAGIRHSFRGDFFLTLDSFQRTYTTSRQVNETGAAVYMAFRAGSPSRGALFMPVTAQCAVMVILIGNRVTAASTIARGERVAGLVLAKLRPVCR